MPLKIKSINNSNKKPASTSRVVRSIRVSAYHDLMFKTMPGNEFPGVLVRMLLDEYFNGRLPELQKKFAIEVSKQKDLQKAILAKFNTEKANKVEKTA